MVEDHAQAAGHRGGMGDDPVGLDGDEVGARGGQVHQAGDDRLVGLGLEPAQLLGHDVAGGDAAAGAVDPQHDRGDAGVARRGVELVAERRQGVVAHGVQAAVILVEQHAVDIDQGDPRDAARAPCRPGRPSATISPGSTAVGSLTSTGGRRTSTAPRRLASAVTPASPRNVAAIGKTWPQPARPSGRQTGQQPEDGRTGAGISGRRQPALLHLTSPGRPGDESPGAAPIHHVLSATQPANLAPKSLRSPGPETTRKEGDSHVRRCRCDRDGDDGAQ